MTTLRGEADQKLSLACPSLPQTLAETLDLLNDPDEIQVKQVTRIIERDPAVCARLLKKVNSAFYGLRPEIENIERAVVSIGPIDTVSLVMSMGIGDLADGLDDRAQRSFKRLINHCLATAFLSRRIIGYLDESRYLVGNAFLAGLLHDFGRVVLFFNFPETAPDLYESEALEEHAPSREVLALERQMFGVDHLQAGAYASKKMDFPDLLTDTLLFHEEGPEGNALLHSERLLRVVTASNIAVRAMGFHFVAPLTWGEAQEDTIWENLVRSEGMDITPRETIDLYKTAKPEVRKYVHELLPAK